MTVIIVIAVLWWLISKDMKKYPQKSSRSTNSAPKVYRTAWRD